MSVSAPGSAQWRQAHSSQLNALMQRVMQQTGQQDVAEDAARAAEAALSDIFHQTVVSSGGDQEAAIRATQYYSSAVFQLAGLVPQITGDDARAGSAALREARQILQGVGIDDPQFMYPWLRTNVENDQILRGAGLDPERVRHVDNPWAHADLEGLMGLARQMLTQYRDADGRRLSDSDIARYMDQAYDAARRNGVGTRYVAPNAEDSASATGETFTVQDLNIPRRI